MYNTSQNYKNYIKEPSRMFESKIILGSRTLNNDDVIQLKTELQQPSNGFTLGSCISKSLELTLNNDGGAYASVGIVNVSLGLKMGELIEYIPQGIFNIDKVEKTDYTVKVTAYDNMIKFETAYSEKYDNPTLKQVIQQLQDITGVEFDSSVTIPSYTLNKLSGYTCREILGYVASLMGGNAYITREGKLTIVVPVEVDYTVTSNNYWDYDLEDNTYKIGMLTCQNKLKNDAVDESDDYEAIEEKNTISAGSLGTDNMELTFINPWMTETILNTVYNKLKSFSFLGYSMKWQGDLSLDVGNIINVIDKHGVTRKAFMFSDKINYNGGLTQETGAKGQTKSSNQFSTVDSPTELDRISVKVLLAEKAIIQKANIADLTAVSAKVGTLDVSIATINTALINKANIDDLNATNANVTNLNAQYANLSNAIINKADIADLNATNANISNLKATVADISTLVSGNLTSANIHSLVLTADKVTVQNGFIKNAMIESLDVTKINAGTLNTNKISVSSSDGGLVIAGATQQFKDKNGKVRIQMGQDAQGNFNFILVAGDGTTTLIDGTGVKANAIADKLIKTNMVADQAIGSQQINYSSFVTGFNASTNTNFINASKVAIDLTGQTLDIAFNNMNTTVTSVQSTANTAKSTADTASSNANNAVSTANSANTSASTALNNANSALDTANTAKTTATTASTNASNAVNTANSANSTANTANTNASTAVNTANTALSTANNIQVGGRNLLIDTDEIKYVNVNIPTSYNVFDPYSTYNRKTLRELGFVANDIVTISFNWDIDKNGSLSEVYGNFRLEWKGINSSGIDNQYLGLIKNPVDTFSSSNTSGKAIVTTQLTESVLDSHTVRFRIDNSVIAFKVSKMKLEKGNKSTDWTPAPEDIDQTIASVKTVTETNTTSISAIQGQISTLISNTTITAIDGTTTQLKDAYNGTVNTINSMKTTIGEHTTDINANTKNITSVTSRTSTLETNLSSISATLSSTKSTVDTHTTQISTANTNITTALNNASSAVSTANTANTTANSAKTTATTASTNVATLTTTVTNTTSRVASLELTTSGLSTRVGATETTLTNLSIGGRNFIKNSNFYIGSSYWGLTSVATVDTSFKYNSHNTLKLSRLGATTDNWYGVQQTLSCDCSQGKIYTASCYYYIDDISKLDYGFAFEMKGKTSSGDVGIASYPTFIAATAVSKKWTKISYTFTINRNDLTSIFAYPWIKRNGIVWFADFKLEEGNQATSWSPAPEDVQAYTDTQISSAKSEIKQTTDSISQSVSNINSSITTINNTLGNKAEKSTVESINNSVTSLNTTLSGITGRVSTLETNTTTLTTTLNNLQVGGRNLVKFSRLQDLNYYTKANPNSNLSCVVDGYLSGFGYLQISSTGFTSNSWTGFTGKLTETLKEGKQYTLSGYYYIDSSISNDNGMSIIIKNHANNKAQGGFDIPRNITDSWEYFKTTFTAHNTSYMPHYLYAHVIRNGCVRVAKLKLEEGNQDTSWTPAPEDVENEITTVRETVTSNTTEISALKNSISLKVDSTTLNSYKDTVNGQINTINSSISSMQSSIDLQLDSIKSSVSKTVSTKNLINNSAFNKELGFINKSGTNYACRISKKSEYTGWGYTKAPVADDNVLYIRYDKGGDNYCEFRDLYAMVKPNTKYTFSYYYTLNGPYTAPSSYLYERNASGFGKIIYTNPIIIGPDKACSRDTWIRYSRTLTTGSDTDSIMVRFGFHSNDGSCEMLIAGLQLEESSSATDWVEGNVSNIGTVITQSPAEVMTAFNGISQYFQISSDGAKFGNIATGDYTSMNDKGLVHHIGSTGYEYMYVSGAIYCSLEIPQGGLKNYKVLYSQCDNWNNLKELINGKIPKVYVVDKHEYPRGPNMITSSNVFIESTDETGFYVTATIKGSNVTVNSYLSNDTILGSKITNYVSTTTTTEGTLFLRLLLLA
ncbi:carbohydrate binding domain-containing protein [Clostridium butyricum]|uniref:carbohydrate binding domain-containing protein n=1 Tax=Clostridium butyricum TaxID=1492 RepID=UPI003D3469D9